jgi:hypothetical protein
MVRMRSPAMLEQGSNRLGVCHEMAAKIFARNRDRMHTSRIALLYEPIDSLKPNPKNARKHSKKQTRQIAQSVDTFGFNNPLLIDAERNIIAGHARVEAAKQLGLTEVPVVPLALTAAEAKAYALADNQLALNASWDMPLLCDTFRELDILDLGFGLEVDRVRGRRDRLTDGGSRSEDR